MTDPLLPVPYAEDPDLPAVKAIGDAVLARLEPASREIATANAEDAEQHRAEAATIETYLRRIKASTEAIGAAQTIQLRARMRLGELQPRRSPPGTSLPGGQEVEKNAAQVERHRNRLLYGARQEVEKKVAELAPKGEATPNAILRHLRREQRRHVDEGARTIAPTEGLEAATGEGWTILPGRAVEALQDWPTASVDLILTDPPYPADQLDRWTELADLAARLLVPHGILAALTGQILLPEVLDRVRSSGLRFGWIYCQLLPGQHSRILGRNLAQSWKPWLVLTNGGWPVGINERHEDVLPASPAEKAGYSWRQTVGPARYLIENLSPRGGVVLDPFLGSGTYGVAALETGRRFVGVEADGARFAQAADRLRETRT